MPTILLVEDSASQRTLLAEILGQAGHRIIAAHDGRHALSALGEHAVDLIVSDIYMPGGDGIELLTALKRRGNRVPIIAMSSMAGEWDMLRSARCLGASVTLRKPFSPAELLARIDALLPRPAEVPLGKSKVSFNSTS